MKSHNLPKPWSIVIVYALLFAVFLVLGFVFVRIGVASQDSKSETVGQSVSRIYQKCKTNLQPERCYGTQFAELAKKRDITYTLNVLHSLQNTDTGTRSCHFIAHKISQAEVEKNPTDWLKMFGKVDLSECSRGFFHGAIEGHLEFNPDFVVDKNSIPQICKQISTDGQTHLPDSKINSLCVHALGHILLVQTEGIINKSIDICSQVPSSMQYDCYDGVFMENTNRENLQLHGISSDLIWDLKNAQQVKNICNTYTGLSAKACWSSLGEMMGSVSNGDNKTLYNLCQEANEKSDKQNCYVKGAGFVAFLQVTNKEYSNVNMASFCNSPLIEDSLVNSCIQQVTSYVLNTSTTYSEKLLPFCAGMFHEHIAYCYQETASILSYIAPAKKTNWCNSIPSEYKNACN